MMNLQAKAVVIAGVLALTAAAPTLAAQPAGDPPYGQGQGKGPIYAPVNPGDPTPGPKAGLPTKAKAYGRYCQGKSKQHVEGEEGTAFSRCVKAVAKLRNDLEEKEAV